MTLVTAALLISHVGTGVTNVSIVPGILFTSGSTILLAPPASGGVAEGARGVFTALEWPVPSISVGNKGIFLRKMKRERPEALQIFLLFLKK